MTQDEIIFLIIVVSIFIIMGFYIDWTITKSLKCKKGEEHNWVFICNSKGNTGDLGFGIKGSWNINHYRCSNCGKEKEEEIY